MKILLINNNTEHLSSLQQSLLDHDVQIQDYRPGVDFCTSDKDLVILSGGGGEGLEIHDIYEKGKLWYDDQMRFVRECQLPLLGICMGFEVIARAYGSPVTLADGLIEGPQQLEMTDKGRSFFKHRRIKQFEAHNWRVEEAPEEFEVLATSPSGIEIIKHKVKPILATQFHPEKGGTLKLAQLLHF